MDYPKDLIRFSTKNGEAQQLTHSQRFINMLRPRVLMYAGLLLIISIGLVVSLANRASFKVDIMRDRGVMARLVAGGNIENVYRIQITNATESARSYQINVIGLKGLSMLNQKLVKVHATSEQLVPISVQMLGDSVNPGMHAIQFEVTALDTQESIIENSVFYMPVE